MQKAYENMYLPVFQVASTLDAEKFQNGMISLKALSEAELSVLPKRQAVRSDGTRSAVVPKYIRKMDMEHLQYDPDREKFRTEEWEIQLNISESDTAVIITNPAEFMRRLQTTVLRQKETIYTAGEELYENHKTRIYCGFANWYLPLEGYVDDGKDWIFQIGNLTDITSAVSVSDLMKGDIPEGLITAELKKRMQKLCRASVGQGSMTVVGFADFSSFIPQTDIICQLREQFPEPEWMATSFVQTFPDGSKMARVSFQQEQLKIKVLIGYERIQIIGPFGPDNDISAVASDILRFFLRHGIKAYQRFACVYELYIGEVNDRHRMDDQAGCILSRKKEIQGEMVQKMQRLHMENSVVGADPFGESCMEKCWMFNDDISTALTLDMNICDMQAIDRIMREYTAEAVADMNALTKSGDIYGKFCSM